MIYYKPHTKAKIENEPTNNVWWDKNRLIFNIDSMCQTLYRLNSVIFPYNDVDVVIILYLEGKMQHLA